MQNSMKNLCVCRIQKIWDKKREQKLYKSFVKYAGERDFKSILYESLVGTPIEHGLDSFNNKHLF